MSLPAQNLLNDLGLTQEQYDVFLRDQEIAERIIVNYPLFWATYGIMNARGRSYEYDNSNNKHTNIVF